MSTGKLVLLGAVLGALFGLCLYAFSSSKPVPEVVSCQLRPTGQTDGERVEVAKICVTREWR